MKAVRLFDPGFHWHQQNKTTLAALVGGATYLGGGAAWLSSPYVPIAPHHVYRFQATLDADLLLKEVTF